jgi:uncharacterized protein (DUF433 family)
MQIEIPDELAAAVAEIAERSGQDAEHLVTEMVTEAIKMRRVPGIVFADGATGRRARVGGTRIPVYEMMEYYEYVGRDREELRKGFNWLDPRQIDAAIAYYETYPEDITPLMKTEEKALAELHALWAKIPQTNPDWPGHRQSAGSRSIHSAREPV